MISVRIKRARLAAGLSLREAGARAGLSAMAISKFETGAANPTSDSLIRLARALDTRLEFFFRPVPVQLQRPQYRKHASLSGKRLARIEADIMDQVERFCELVALFPNSPVPSFVVPVTVPDRMTVTRTLSRSPLIFATPGTLGWTRSRLWLTCWRNAAC
jgi:transcriptional regulator with XRE-family HTH domain